MKLKTDYMGRLDQCYEVLHKCLVSRDQRRNNYNTLRNYYLYGCGLTDNPDTTYNKIYSHIDQLTSLMFSAETTKFAVTPDEGESIIELKKSIPLSRAVLDEWHACNGDITFGMNLLWAFVFGSSFTKMRWNEKRMELFPVDPVDVGVLREDVQGIHRQDAVVHAYYMTMHQFEQDTRAHPRQSDILKRVSAAPKPREAMAGGTEKIALSQTNPTVVGNLNLNTMFNNRYMPSVSEDLVQVFELYVWDDAENDYTVMTFAEPNVIVWDRPMRDVWIPRELPLTQICPNPDPNYFFGISEVERLIPLQRLRNERMDQVRHLCNLQVKPPKVLSGFAGVTDEMALALDSPNGVINSEIPSAGAKVIQPTIPDDVYKEIREIDTMFEDVSGISGILKGQGESGVRSNSHAKNLANFGSARARKRALVIEDALEKQATLFLQAMQRYDEMHSYRDDDGIQFWPFQFTDSYTVKIDAHSSSPIFVEDQRQLATQMLQLKVIDRESYIDIVDPPMPQLLKMKLKTKIEPAEKAAAQQQAQAEAQKGGGKSKSLKSVK
jgi:hypothetical protein